MRALFLLFLGMGSSVIAQQSYTYRFGSPPFTSDPAGGPTLQAIGTVTAPETVQLPATTCADMPLVTVAHFSRNSGFAMKSFVQDIYSVELVFRLDSVTGRRRLIDFSNGTNDLGIYCVDGCLSFHPFSSPVGPCPGAFNTTDFQHLVITSGLGGRVYLNGQFVAAASDMAYVVGPAPNDSIRFFLDDNVVPNEASSGEVALIRVMDQALALGDVSTSFYTLCQRIVSVEEQGLAHDLFVAPNPASGLIELRLPVTFTGNTDLHLFDAHGALQRTWLVPGPGVGPLSLEGLPTGVYTLKATSSNGLHQMLRIVKVP